MTKKHVDDLAALFAARFPGLDRAHGRFQSNGHPPRADGKIEGKSVWVKTGGATVDLWRQHFAGTYSLGVAPLRDDATCGWGNLDVDKYPADYAGLQQKITALDLPLIITESKSSGAELLLFCKEPLPADVVRRALTRCCAALRLPENTELFPKQDRLTKSNNFGNWLNMPYFGGTSRLARLGAKQLTDPRAFLKLAERKAVTRADLDALITRLEPTHELKKEKKKSTVAETPVRNDWVFKFASAMRRKGLSEEAAMAAVRVENVTFHKGQLSEQELQKAVRSAYGRYEATEADVLAEMNKRYAVVKTGGRVGVLCMGPFENDGTLEILGLGDFRAWLAECRFPDYEDANGKPRRGKPHADLWLEEQHRKFEKIVFDPSGKAPADALNLWRGFAVTPDPKLHPERRCARFLAHVRDNICNGDEALFNWVIAWFAQMVQHPGAKLPTSFVVRGPGGTGKSILGKIIGRLFGRRHHLEASKSEQITGRFNGPLAATILLQGEEAFWAGDKHTEGVIKDLISNDWMNIELKGREAIAVANYLRFFSTSNNEWVVPVQWRERRFTVLDVPAHAHTNSHDYFGAMMKEMEQGGYEALLAYLMAFDWAHYHPERVPQTAALAEQKEYSASPAVKYLLELADQGWLPRDTNGSGLVAKAHLYADFVKRAREGGQGRYLGGPGQFTRTMNTFLAAHEGAALKDHRPARGGERNQTRRRFWEFPPLKELRDVFDRALGSPKAWEGPEDGWGPSEPDDDL